LTDELRIEIQWVSGGLAFLARDTVDMARLLVQCLKWNEYQEVLCPVLEVTVGIRRSYVLCWKLLWISGGLISFAGNNSGYQEVLCPMLEITVDIRGSYVLCWK
jgi:hypothetical protein